MSITGHTSSSGSEATQTSPLLRVEDVRQTFTIRRRSSWTFEHIHAVDGVNLYCDKGDALGIVGESGCGKSTLANIIMRVIQPTAGCVLFKGEDHAARRGRRERELYRDLQMVYQDPYTSLNPILSAGANIMEPLRLQGVGRLKERRESATAMMREVGLREDFFDRRPSEFSGGQRQRIAIARALVLRPELVVLDEPVSSLDVSIQAQVLNLLRRLQQEFALTYLFVSHDLAVVRFLCNRVAVMYLGKIVEMGPSRLIFSRPRHPYTRALLDAIPVPNPQKRRRTGEGVLQGEVPSPINPPSGCRFHPRCPRAQAVCAKEPPKLRIEPEELAQSFACHFPIEVKQSATGVPKLNIGAIA